MDAALNEAYAGTMAYFILKAIAEVEPATLLPVLKELEDRLPFVPGSEYHFASILGSVAKLDVTTLGGGAQNVRGWGDKNRGGCDGNA